MIPIDTANRNGIAVANAPKATAASVAEQVVEQMIALLCHRLTPPRPQLALHLCH